MKVVKTSHKVRWGEGDKKEFIFFHRNKYGKLEKAHIPLYTVYKFGFSFDILYTKKGHPKGLKLIGYLITTRYRRFEKITYGAISKLRKLIREYGKYAITNEELISIETENKKIIQKISKDYIVKFEKNAKFVKLTNKISKSYVDGKKKNNGTDNTGNP